MKANTDSKQLKPVRTDTYSGEPVIIWRCDCGREHTVDAITHEVYKTENTDKLPRCWRCGKEITGIVFGIYNKKWCSIACKRADEEGDWV